MTTEHHSSVGKAIEAYRDNCLHVTCLNEQLHGIGTDLVELGQALKGAPSTVTVRDDQIIIRRRLKITAVSSDAPDYREQSLVFPNTAALGNILTKLAEVSQEHQRLDQVLQGMGLEQFIREVARGP